MRHTSLFAATTRWNISTSKERSALFKQAQYAHLRALRAEIDCLEQGLAC